MQIYNDLNPVTWIKIKGLGKYKYRRSWSKTIGASSEWSGEWTARENQPHEEFSLQRCTEKEIAEDIGSLYSPLILTHHGLFRDYITERSLSHLDIYNQIQTKRFRTVLSVHWNCPQLLFSTCPLMKSGLLTRCLESCLGTDVCFGLYEK